MKDHLKALTLVLGFLAVWFSLTVLAMNYHEVVMTGLLLIVAGVLHAVVVRLIRLD